MHNSAWVVDSGGGPVSVRAGIVGRSIVAGRVIW